MHCPGGKEEGFPEVADPRIRHSSAFSHRNLLPQRSVGADGRFKRTVLNEFHSSSLQSKTLSQIGSKPNGKKNKQITEKTNFKNKITDFQRV